MHWSGSLEVRIRHHHTRDVRAGLCARARGSWPVCRTVPGGGAGMAETPACRAAPPGCQGGRRQGWSAPVPAVRAQMCVALSWRPLACPLAHLGSSSVVQDGSKAKCAQSGLFCPTEACSLETDRYAGWRERWQDGRRKWDGLPVGLNRSAQLCAAGWAQEMAIAMAGCRGGGVARVPMRPRGSAVGLCAFRPLRPQVAESAATGYHDGPSRARHMSTSIPPDWAAGSRTPAGGWRRLADLPRRGGAARL